VKKLAIAMFAAGALATSFISPASAAAPGPADSGCGFTTATDNSPEAPANSQTGVLYGGPIAQNGTLTCTIKVNVGTHNGAYVNGASRSATGTNGTTILNPGVVSYVSPTGEPVYLCDQFNDGTTTWYWDGDLNAWTTNAAAPCELAISAGTDDPIFDPINDLIESLDPTLCEVIKLIPSVPPVLEITAEGDVYVGGVFIWDCPPYEL